MNGEAPVCRGGRNAERNRARELQHALSQLDSVQAFRYGDDTPFSNYFRGEIGHDDLVALAADMIRETEVLTDLFDSSRLGDVLRYCREKGLIRASERINSHLDRPSREEAYDEGAHTEDKADWLADAYFDMHGGEVENYCNFLDENTPYSTQHGVKGEQYDDVIVVFDDTEAAWHNYSFAKMLTPQTAGEPRDSQKERSRKLAYVCFSRAVRNLRVLLFTSDPRSAARELTEQGLFQESQISILD